MKIGIDARLCAEGGYYSKFIIELIDAFVRENSDDEIVIYTPKNCKLSRFSVIDDLKAKKIFEKQEFALMIFFDYHIPHGYKGDFVVVLESLKEIFFPKKKWLHRKIHSYKLSQAIERSTRVICLDTGTALELNESLNIKEEKIGKIPAFFPKHSGNGDSPISIDVGLKHNLKGEYLIYDSGNEVHNNFERILKTIKLLKESGIFLYIIIVCDSTNKDLDIRGKVIEYGITENIIFLGEVSQSDEESYYNQSLGVIFSSIYESFPFHFSKAIAYDCHIFANDIPANKDIMGETITYLDPLSIHNMRDSIQEYLETPTPPDYNKIHSTYTPNGSALELDIQSGMKN